MDDILGILVPLLIFAGFYVFARLQKYLKELNKPGAQQREGAQINAEERMRRRLEALAAKQNQAAQTTDAERQVAQKTGTVRQAAQKKQQREKPKPVSAPVEEQTQWQSEEEMIEKLGLIEFERREALGEIPASIRRQRASEVPTSTAVHRHMSSQLTGSSALRRVVIAKEILDRPVSMRPPHNPFKR